MFYLVLSQIVVDSTRCLRLLMICRDGFVSVFSEISRLVFKNPGMFSNASFVKTFSTTTGQIVFTKRIPSSCRREKKTFLRNFQADYSESGEFVTTLALKVPKSPPQHGYPPSPNREGYHNYRWLFFNFCFMTDYAIWFRPW